MRANVRLLTLEMTNSLKIMPKSCDVNENIYQKMCRYSTYITCSFCLQSGTVSRIIGPIILLLTALHV